eukprot:Skav204616  [mRNA]  locus=scaffold1712:118523:119764:+ [translate_table: standard]
MFGQCGRTDTLSSDDMKLLFQLQVLNRELRSELGSEEVPQVDVQTEEFVDQLRQAALEGYLLSEELQSLEKELSAMNLTEAQLSMLDRELEKHEDLEPFPEDLEMCCAGIMEEVQTVTRQNIELSSSYEERIRRIEVELQNVMQDQYKQGIVPSWMLRQLEALESDCETLEMRWQKVQKHQEDEEHQQIQRLQMENEVQLQELGRLREMIKDGNQEKSPAPDAEPLETEAVELRREIDELLWRKRSDQAKAEQQSQQLRSEIRALEDRLQKTKSQKSVMEEVVEGLKNSHSATANSSRELRELQRDQEFLEKECIRSERRIIILDEKIESLSKEAEDLRQRAAVVMSALPEPVEVSYLQRQQQVLRELRGEQSQLQRAQDLANQELEAAKVEASVLERKIRSLGGTPSLQGAA